MKVSSNKLLNKFLLTAIICFISFIISHLFFQTDIQKNIQSSIYDSLFKIKINVNDNSKKTDNIIIIPIDEHALDVMNNKGIYYPWPRYYYGMIASHLINEGAKAVVFDMIFSNPDKDILDYESGGILYGADSDNFFNNFIKSGKVFLCYSVDKKINNNESLDTININNITNYKNIPLYTAVLKPYSLFVENNKNLGFVDIEADSDGVIRSYIPAVNINNKYYPSLATSIYLKNNNNLLPDKLQLDENGTFTINWYGQGGINKTFKYISPIAVLSDYINKANKTGSLDLPANIFKDKIVFIGATARGLLDMKSTPFSKLQAYPGVEIHATAYLNLTYNDWIKNYNPLLEFIIYFIILLSLVFFWIDTKYPVRYSFIFFIIILLILSIHVLLFIFYNIILQTTFFAFSSFLIIFIAAQITNYLLVGNLKNKIKTAFSTYISPELLNKILSTNKPLTAYGEKVNASALFIDIAGFTTFSEKNSVEKVVEILNLYLKKFSEAIILNNGWVNKYLGDGLMALYGVLGDAPDHADMAVKSAFECYTINKELSKEYGLNVRIGVNSGSLIFGSFGADEKKLEFTAIGDCVNSTSRLEGANKFFSTNILVGETAYNLLKEKYNLNYIGKFSLKGKDISNQIYYFSDDNSEHKIKFNQMIDAYENADLNKFLEYVKYFENINFGPAKYYINFYNNNKDKFGKPVKLTEK